MKTIINLFAFFLPMQLISLSAIAQNKNVEEVFTKNVINFYGNYRFMQNDRILLQKDIKPLLLNYEESAKEYNSYKKRAVTTTLLMLGTLAGYILAANQANKNEGLAIGAGIAGFACNLIAIPIASKGRKSLQRSVWLYNKNILSRNL